MSVPMMMPVATAGMPATRAMSPEWFAFNGISQADGIEIYNSLQSYGRAPADEAWVYRCVSLKASFAQGVPLRAYVKEGKTRVPAEDSGNAAAEDLQSLLDDANPMSMNGSDLKAYTTAALSVWGGSYWRKVRGRYGGAPQELWWLRTPDVTAKKGRVWIDAYEYHQADGTSDVYKTRDIVSFLRFNLQDPTKPLSPLSAARYDLAVDRKAAQWTASTLENWGVPPIAWVIPNNAEFTPQDRSLVQRALRALRGPRNKGKTPILPQGLEPKVLSLSPHDAEWLASRKVSRMTVCGILGVPLVLAGDDDKASVYANMRDAERVFARSMISELDWEADTLNGWLVPDFDPAPRARRKIGLAFDYSEIEALQAPVEDRKRVALQELERRARTPDEYRAEFKIGDPLPNGAGAELMQLMTLVPIDDTASSGTAATQPAAANPEPPSQVPEKPDTGSDAARAAEILRVIGRSLYSQSSVRAWVTDPSVPLNTLSLVGAPLDDALRLQIEAGLRRRASAGQIAASLIEGVPA